MKKAIIIGIIIGLIISIGVLSIPKHNMPTDAEWETYLETINSTRPTKETLRGFTHCSPVQ